MGAANVVRHKFGLQKRVRLNLVAHLQMCSKFNTNSVGEGLAPPDSFTNMRQIPHRPVGAHLWSPVSFGLCRMLLFILCYTTKNEPRKGTKGLQSEIEGSPLGSPFPTAFLRCGRGVERSKTDAPPSLMDERRCGLVLRAMFCLNGGCECCSA